MTAEPSRSIEVELKLDVDEDTPLPDLATLPGVATVSGGEHRSLDAVYFDTPDRVLAHSGVALRRRTGGPDAGWHIKGPLVDGGRVELHWELDTHGAVPPAVLRGLATVMDAAPPAPAELAPLARIRNERTAYALLDASGALVAEFVDDHVQTTDERTEVQRTWREWELELGPAASADHASFFAAALAAAKNAGARPAASASKLARALGT